MVVSRSDYADVVAAISPEKSCIQPPIRTLALVIFLSLWPLVWPIYTPGSSWVCC